MGYIWMYLVLMTIAFALAIKTEKKVDFTIFLSIAGIALIEYVCGLLINLIVANIIIYILAGICLIYLTSKCIREKSIKCILNKITPGSILLTVIYIVTIILYKEKLVTQHNEVGAWALLVKYLRDTHELPKYGSSMIYTGYVPLAGLWHYFVSTFFSNFSDGNVYISSALMQYSMAIATMSFIKFKDWKESILSNLLNIFSLFMVCYLIFTSLYIDTTLGLAFALGLIYIYNIDKLKLSDMIAFSFINLFLVLIKDSGILFSVILIILLGINEIFKNRDEEKKNTKKIVIYFVVLILLIVMSRTAWGIYLDVNNLNGSGDTSQVNITNVLDLITGEAPKYRYETLKNFGQYLLTGKNFELFGVNISIALWTLINVVVILITYIVKKDKNILKILMGILVANIAFLLGTLATYLFIFAQWEAEVLSAFSRYTRTLVIINTIAMIYVIVNYYEHKKLISVAMLIAVVIASDKRGINEIIQNKENIQTYKEIREEYMGIEKYREVLTEKDKIWVVASYEEDANNRIIREIDLLRFKYQIFPHKVGMLFELHATEEQIIDKFKVGYTYIYFLKGTKDVYDRFNFLLDEGREIEQDKLYKVINENNNWKIELVEINGGKSE